MTENKPLAITRSGDQLVAFYPGMQPAPQGTHPTPSGDFPDLPVEFACVAARHQGKALFVFNPRRDEWELPAGGIEPGETALAAAHRELFEESGQVCPELRFAGMVLLHIARTNHFELGAMFSGNVATVQPFSPNTETSELMFWDLRSPVQGYVNALALKLAQLTQA